LPAAERVGDPDICNAYDTDEKTVAHYLLDIEREKHAPYQANSVRSVGDLQHADHGGYKRKGPEWQEYV
jgi:hypothetical protein